MFQSIKLNTINFLKALWPLSFTLLFLLPACGDSNLDTLDGPKSGKVSGLVCYDLQILLAAREQDVVRTAMVENGKCKNVRYAKQVKVERTVMMPTDGKYSQILWLQGDEKYWVRTDRIK